MSIISSRAAVLKWIPPPNENRNGEITGYTIDVTTLDSGDRVQLTSVNTSVNVATLKPHTTYSFTASAETLVGVGPYSYPVIARTLEDGNVG